MSETSSSEWKTVSVKNEEDSSEIPESIASEEKIAEPNNSSKENSETVINSSVDSVKPDIQPGPAPKLQENLIDPEVVRYAEVTDNSQPGERPGVLTPILRSDMHHNKMMAAFSYIPLGFLFVLALKDNSRFSVYHARQGVIVFFTQFVCSFFSTIPFLGPVIFAAGLVLSLIGIISCIRAKEYYKFPVLGDLSEKLTFI